MRPWYDVAVIGSGFGGAITACRLAQAGRSVCVLERGRRWRPGDFPRTTAEVAKDGFWDEQRSYGLLEYRPFKRVDVIQGAGVGGGSLWYFNVRLRTPEEIFRAPAWPERITRARLDPYYDRVQSVLGAAPLQPPDGRGLPKRTRAFMAATEDAGRRAKLVDIAVHTGADRSAPDGERKQSACVYCGNCLFGCHVGAKNSLDFNYLATAENNGAEIFPLHVVDGIEPVDGEGYAVSFRSLDANTPGRAEPGRVRAKQVIVAAGALGSTELLLRCRANGSLPKLGATLGKRFSTNGDFLLAGTFKANRVVDAGRGPSITAVADFSTDRHKIFIEDLGFPDPLLWFLEGAIPTGGRLARTAKLAWTYLASAFGLRGGENRVSLAAGDLFRGGTTTRMLPYLGMGTDAADGELRLRNDRVDVQWSHRRSRAMFRQMERAMQRLSSSLDGEYVNSLLWSWPLRKLLTAHPLGGCATGDNADDSVVDHRGQVWSYPGLFVADGAVVPSALAVNPSLTISALAERTAQWILHERELS